MLFSESWLRTYVNPAISSEELQDALTMHGLEVDEARKAAPDFTGVVIAEVVECRDHENSDHLHVCQVNAGTGELIQIVCGAPNVRAGVRVPCAMVGAELPGGFKIKKAKLRGVPSNGMLCSVSSACPRIMTVSGFCRKTPRSAKISASTLTSTTSWWI